MDFWKFHGSMKKDGDQTAPNATIVGVPNTTGSCTSETGPAQSLFFFFLAGVPSTVNHQGPNDSIALDHGGIRGIAARSETPTFRLPEEAEMRSVRLFT
jgi:hypothetical protein